MNTFWLKVMTIVVAVAAIIVVVGIFTSSEKSPPEPKPEEKTFQDMVERDKEEFLNKPKTAAEQTPASPAAQQPAAVKQTPAQPTKLYFKPLSEMEKIEAERLLNAAVPGRSIGRLPMASGAGFKLMVDSCRQIIKRWPDSWYAYNAKRMLIDMPERFRSVYKITLEELDLSKFSIQRPGTVLYTGNDASEEDSY
jgi:hypothetical protein